MRILRDFMPALTRPLGFGVAALAIVFGPALAFAQTAATTIDVGSVFGQALPTIELVGGVVGSAVVGLIAYGLHRLIGVTIDAKMRGILLGAAENAAHSVLVAAQGKLAGKTIDVRSPLLAAGVGYLRTYVPAALRHFGLTDDALRELLSVQIAKIVPKDAGVAA